jgi:RNA polymerase sigma factor (sigma-70 family)
LGLAMDLEAALASLGDEDRAVVWLHDVEGYGHKEIAEMFGKTESFSKTRLSRARARLRSLLEGPGESIPGEAPGGKAAGGIAP